MAPRGETRRRILDTAGMLFQRQGYHATGLNQILAEAGAPKGSLYFHFPGGKEQLAVEATEQAADQWGQAIDAVLAQTDDVGAVALAIADLLGAVLSDSEFRDGCPLATLALEVAADSDQLRMVCARGYQRWTDLITADLRARRVPEDQADDLAVFILASIEGALLLAKARHDIAPLRQVATRLAAVIAAAQATG